MRVLSPRGFLGCSLAVLACLISPARAFAASLYGVTQAGELITIDPTTGAGSLVGATGFTGLDALDFDAGGNLLAIGTNNDLISINTTTGAGTLIGDVTGYVAVEGLAFGGGTLYGAADKLGGATAETLITINPTTAAATEIGPFNNAQANDIEALAIDAAGNLFAAHLGNNRFFSIDPSTGQATLIGVMSTSLRALEFSPSGDLYGATSASNRLVTVNPGTGAITDIGPIGFSLVSGLAYVPEPSSFALAALAMLLLPTTVLARRRRSKALS